jgi:hypothetical protein
MSVKDTDLLGNASSIDENIDVAVVNSDIVDSLLNGSLIANIDLVKANIDTSLGGELAGRLLTQLLLNVEDGNALDANLRKGLSHVVTQSAAAAMSELAKSEVRMEVKRTYPVITATLPQRVNFFMVGGRSSSSSDLRG